MESSIYTWLQPHQPDHPVHHSPPPAQDWQKQQGQQSQPGPVAASPPHQQPTLDLSDFTSLADLPAPSSSSSSAASPPSSQSTFYPFTTHPGFYGSNPYYASSWGTSTQPSQSPDPIPLSSYSTLNGATSANTGLSSSQQQQQQPQQSSQMMIE
ncbi:hypothetical protein B0H19DRAFT_291720 [Mycena capillaripes]|nr:hypothetical protein B0H19DRAFT_291720 [Mycena capillaripes]